MQGTCSKISSENTWQFPRLELLQGYVLCDTQFERNLDLILTMLLKYCFFLNSLF